MALNTRDSLDLLIELARSKGAEDIVVMDLRGLIDTADYFLICTGNSDVHIRTLADSLVEGMKDKGEGPWHIEGYRQRYGGARSSERSHLRWVLIDFVNVIVHIFGRSARQFYSLERLWGDAQMEWIDEGEKVGQEDEDDVLLNRL